MNTFYSKDGTRGHCLPCIDLERGRDAGTCPLLSYKHFMEKLNGVKPRKCYNDFDDLADMFDSEVTYRNNFLLVRFSLFYHSSS